VLKTKHVMKYTYPSLSTTEEGTELPTYNQKTVFFLMCHPHVQTSIDKQHVILYVC